MSKELPYFKFNVNRWITGDVSLCSVEAQGLFASVCAYYWSKRCNISLAFVQRKFNKEDLLKELLDLEVITLDGDNIIIDFLDKQMGEFEDIIEKRSRAGKESARKRALLKESSTSDEQMLNKSSTKVNNIEKIREDKIREDKSILFERFWNLYDKKVGKKELIKKKFLKLKKEEIDLIFEFIPKYIKSQPEKKYRKNPDTFLNNESWKDEIITGDERKSTSNQSRVINLRNGVTDQ